MQQNSKCRLCGDREETINYIFCESSKFAQKVYKTRHEWVEEMINWELCKKLKYDDTSEWYMHNPEFVRENETQKFHWSCELKLDHPISARRPDLVRVKKKKKKSDLAK